MKPQSNLISELDNTRDQLKGQAFTVQLNNELETAQLATGLAHQLVAGDIVHLEGPLGAGKTFFSQRLIAALGYTGKVLSPTYSLVQTYGITLPEPTESHTLSFSVKLQLHHFDLYRLADPEELEFIGIRDHFNSDSICLIEWPTKGEGIIPTPTIQITLAYDQDNFDSRIASIQYTE